MKSIIKNTVKILTLAAALFAVSVQPAKAQSPITRPADGTWVVANANAVSNVPAGTISLDVSKWRNVHLEWTAALNGTDVTNCGVVFIPVFPDSTRPTTPTTAYQFQVNRLTTGTTPIVVQTNFDVLGFTRLDLQFMTNGSATMLLSNKFRIVGKPNI